MDTPGKPALGSNAPRSPHRSSARDRLLQAAGQCFYEEGVQSVGIDKVIERAGVAKASLYGNFKGKDELVRAYLAERQQARVARVERHLARAADPLARVLAPFDALAEACAAPNYHGCAFVRASAEMRADSCARQVCDDARHWTRELFTGLLEQAGAADAVALARQLVLLYDGAAVSADLDHDPAAARAARDAAENLLRQASVCTGSVPAQQRGPA